ncbi:MAG TPA: glycerophosphodiester phosphodiesterase family protein [Gemmataceae bacterium]|nr:glycerophosphodiester phosphodiesterase family protein [Gemmataceae bacterium]
MSIRRFDLQGHRGARGLKPENTLPSFEAALDVGVTTIETDVLLTADGVPVLRHDHALSELRCRPLPGTAGPDPARRPILRSLTLAQLRGYRADLNPEPHRFATQDARVTPLAEAFATERGIDPYTPPTLDELFAFAAAYAGEAGAVAGKIAWPRARARQVRFDLELKRVSFRPHYLDDGYDGSAPSLLEQRVVDAVRRAGVVERTSVRSFDHRSPMHLKRLESGLRTAILVAGTTPADPVLLVHAAAADCYCPDVEFLDRFQVRQLHDAGIAVVPWTVNEPEDWERLLDWGVDGITTDYPDRLAEVLRGRGLNF